MSYSRIEKTTLPSALSGFTSEFDMVSGGSHSLLSSDKILITYCDPIKLQNQAITFKFRNIS